MELNLGSISESIYWYWLY